MAVRRSDENARRQASLARLRGAVAEVERELAPTAEQEVDHGSTEPGTS
jgi:hypothetical protein